MAPARSPPPSFAPLACRLSRLSITYPQNWLVSLPGGQVTVTALEADQELSVPIVDTGYWEGDCSISGAINGSAVTGQGYTEIMPTCTLPLSL